MTYIEELESLLKKGLYIDNLNKMVSVCDAATQESDDVLIYFTLRSIFSGISASWSDRPLPASEAKNVESRLVPPIKNLIKSIKGRSNQEENHRLLTEIVKIYYKI